MAVARRLIGCTQRERWMIGRHDVAPAVLEHLADDGLKPRVAILQ